MHMATDDTIVTSRTTWRWKQRYQTQPANDIRYQYRASLKRKAFMPASCSDCWPLIGISKDGFVLTLGLFARFLLYPKRRVPGLYIPENQQSTCDAIMQVSYLTRRHDVTFSSMQTQPLPTHSCHSTSSFSPLPRFVSFMWMWNTSWGRACRLKDAP
jgi:hypothetical protein